MNIHHISTENIDMKMSNTSEYPLQLSDSNDYFNFNILQDESMTDKSSWDFTPSINSPFQEPAVCGNLGESLMHSSINFNVLNSENWIDKCTSDLTLSSINEIFVETTADENFDKSKKNIFDIYDFGIEESISDCFEEFCHDFNDNYSLYGELPDPEIFFDGSIKETHHKKTKTDLLSKANNLTEFVIGKTYDVVIGEKLFKLKHAKIVLTRLSSSTLLAAKTKVSEISKSKKKKNYPRLPYVRYCPTCNNTAVTNTHENNVVCVKCGTKLMFQCIECSITCETYSRMTSHINTKPCVYSVRAFKCPNCRKSYKSEISLKNHIRYCKKEAKFSCQFCCRKTKIKRDLIRHEHNCKYRQIVQGDGNLEEKFQNKNVNNLSYGENEPTPLKM